MCDSFGNRSPCVGTLPVTGPWSAPGRCKQDPAFSCISGRGLSVKVAVEKVFIILESQRLLIEG